LKPRYFCYFFLKLLESVQLNFQLFILKSEEVLNFSENRHFFDFSVSEFFFIFNVWIYWNQLWNMLKQLSKIIYDFFQVKIMTSFFVRNILVIEILNVPVCQLCYSDKVCQLRINYLYTFRQRLKIVMLHSFIWNKFILNDNFIRN